MSLPVSMLLLNAFCTLTMVSWIFITASEDCSASFLTSSATTANPLPCSPALAASIAAFSASRLVCCAILPIVSAIIFMLSTTFPSSMAFSILFCFISYKFLVSVIAFSLLFLTSVALPLNSFALLLPSIAFEDNIFILESTSWTDALISSVVALDSCIPAVILFTASSIASALEDTSSTIAESSSDAAVISCESSIINLTKLLTFSWAAFNAKPVCPNSSFLVITIGIEKS